MASDFLAYWKTSTVDRQIEKGGGGQEHAASNQFDRIIKGDTVWLVTVRDGRLRLVTRIVVEHVTGRAGTARLLECRPADLWDAEYHILAVPGTELEIIDADITHVARSLRFDSAAGHDQLAVEKDGTINPQQLRSMRVLSPASVLLLDRVITQKASNG